MQPVIMANNTTILAACNFTTWNMTWNVTWNATLTQNLSNCSNTSLTNSSILQPHPILHRRPNAFPFDPDFKIFSYVWFGLIFLVGVCGNSIVLYVLGYRKKKLTSCDIYILALAFTDLISSICAPMDVLNQIITNLIGWFYGEVMCHILPAIMPITFDSSVWLLVAISCDRYRIIVKPMALHPSRRRTYVIVVIIWTFAIAYNVPLLLQLELRDNRCTATNKTILKGGKLEFFLLTIFFLLWGASNFLLIAVYWRTIRALKRNRVQHANNQAMLKRDKENANIVKMFIIIVALFVTFTIPEVCFVFTDFFLVDVLELKDIDLLIKVHKYRFVFVVTSTATVCINPIIYARLHKDINQFFRVTGKRLIDWIMQCFQSILKPSSKDSYTVYASYSQSETEIYVVGTSQ
eukprot:Seg2883.2 transcript_id=Seg2883.2/GoldUCD/mRNA.D3Y31 product="Neuropeptide FF receptor 2" protein_id=Seg2883.2/GoldUCD/D3Y31